MNQGVEWTLHVLLTLAWIDDDEQSASVSRRGSARGTRRRGGASTVNGRNANLKGLGISLPGSLGSRGAMPFHANVSSSSVASTSAMSAMTSPPPPAYQVDENPEDMLSIEAREEMERARRRVRERMMGRS